MASPNNGIGDTKNSRDGNWYRECQNKRHPRDHRRAPISVATTSRFADRPIGESAASLPCAAALFRRHKLDFCCGGAAPLAAAASSRNVPLDGLEAALGALEAADPGLRQAADRSLGIMAGTDAQSRAAADLAAHIVAHYHAAHRADLPRLAALAERLDPADPARRAGLVALLSRLAGTLGAHMGKEEEGLFLAIMQGGPVPAIAVEILRDEHEDHVADRERLAALLALGADARGEVWAALRERGEGFLADLAEHVRLEDEVLFRLIAPAP
jgi:regulator of cell morphogenesis and NO signaling